MKKIKKYYENLKQGINQGKILGIEEGIEQTNINNARSMKLENKFVELIKKITGLDTSFIASL